MHSHFNFKETYHTSKGCLNPCCNGRCTRTPKSNQLWEFWYADVLILVVMEDALALCVPTVLHTIMIIVLILVVMEDALAPAYLVKLHKNILVS